MCDVAYVYVRAYVYVYAYVSHVFVCVRVYLCALSLTYAPNFIFQMLQKKISDERWKMIPTDENLGTALQVASLICFIPPTGK